MLPSAISSVKDLERILTPGTDTNKLVSQLGQPGWIQRTADGKEKWHYDLPAFPADDKMRGSYFVGVSVLISNGVVGWWGGKYADAPRAGKSTLLPSSDNGKGAAGNTNRSVMKFCVVSTSPAAGTRRISTERFPDVGYISDASSLAIRALKDATVREDTLNSPDDRRVTWTFGISLLQEDAQNFKTLTMTNVGRTVLVMFDEEPVVTARINDPIETGHFTFPCDDPILMTKIKTQLSKMKGP